MTSPEPTRVERDLKPCAVCGGPASIEEIDSSIGVLVSVECSYYDCEMYSNNGWFQHLERAEAAWNHRQIGEAAMNGVLPFAPSSEEGT